jgi:response regulator RpfG family c-di-GMP phosphodiesterase
MSARILLVDDEPSILEAYKRSLRNHFTLVTANSGSEALDILASEEAFAVIVSDMKMPQMNGIELLSTVKDKYPNIVRLLLTGNADQETAVLAINTSDVFQFLQKPCQAEQMIAAIEKALDHHRLLALEQNLLESTVHGSILALVEVLSLTSPKIFGHAEVVKKYASICGEALGLPKLWELESAALLGQIGAVTLLENTIDKITRGTPLSEDEKRAYKKCPEIGAQLISKIPRLENVSEIIRYQNKGYDGSGLPENNVSGENIPIGARVLRATFDLVASEASGLSSEEALSKISSRSELYDPEVLNVLKQTIGSDHTLVMVSITVLQLEKGMTVATDIEAFDGTLLVKKGQTVTESMLERLINFSLNKLAPDHFFVYRTRSS